MFVPHTAVPMLSSLLDGESWLGKVVPVFRKLRTTLFLTSFNSEIATWEGELPAALAEITFRLKLLDRAIAETTKLPRAGEMLQFATAWTHLGFDLTGVKVLFVLQGNRYFAFDLFLGSKTERSRVLVEEEPKKRSANEMLGLSEV